MIPCTDTCVYQRDGLCSLERAASPGSSNRRTEVSRCVHYIGRRRK